MVGAKLLRHPSDGRLFVSGEPVDEKVADRAAATLAAARAGVFRSLRTGPATPDRAGHATEAGEGVRGCLRETPGRGVVGGVVP